MKKEKRKTVALAAVVVGLLIGSGPALAQFDEIHEIGTPNAELPDYVPAEQGQLSIWADFEHPFADGQVSLYLVNRTEADIQFRHQDGDLFFKLERQRPDGGWERVQLHKNSWCGNSYGVTSIKAHSHAVQKGWMPAQETGTPARVRYRCFGSFAAGRGLTTNVGDGVFDEEIAKTARFDVMASRSIPSQLANLLTFPEDEDGNSPHESLYLTTSTTYATALRVLSTLKENPYFRREAAQYLEWLREKPKVSDSSPENAVEVISSILAEKWPAEIDRLQFLERCVDALEPGWPGPPVFGDFRSNRPLLWQTLTEVWWDRPKTELTPAEVAAWTRVYKIVEEEFVDGRYDSVSAIGIDSVADQLLPSAFFERWLVEANDEGARTVCATTLARREEWSRLAELGFKLNPEVQLTVLGTLAQMYRLDSARNPESEIETEFWAHCMETQPLESARVLGGRNQWSRSRAPFGLLVSDPIRAVIKAELAKSRDMGEFELSYDQLKLSQVIAFLSHFKDGQDNYLFQQLLTHGGYFESRFGRANEAGGVTEFVMRRFKVRLAARDALKGRDMHWPSDTVFEEESEEPTE
ncbi:MAG: hypothetical protein ACI8UO_004879 [Verrucomicrobiales bacterium]|jgi:hypothetical protein